MGETWGYVLAHWHQDKFQSWANCVMCWMSVANPGLQILTDNSATHYWAKRVNHPAMSLPSKTDWPLRWRYNERDSVSNHQPHDCLLNRLFRHRSKKTSKLHVTGLCVGNSPGTVNSPHKWPVTRKMFPFDDVIMISCLVSHTWPKIFECVRNTQGDIFELCTSI